MKGGVGERSDRESAQDVMVGVRVSVGLSSDCLIQTPFELGPLLALRMSRASYLSRWPFPAPPNAIGINAWRSGLTLVSGRASFCCDSAVVDSSSDPSSKGSL